MRRERCWLGSLLSDNSRSVQSWHRCLVFCHHLINLVARASTSGGIVRPICFAVFRFITSSNFVGCSTGRSAGFLPFKNLVYINRRTAEFIGIVCGVGHKSSVLDEYALEIDSWQAILSRVFQDTVPVF